MLGTAGRSCRTDRQTHDPHTKPVSLRALMAMKGRLADTSANPPPYGLCDRRDDTQTQTPFNEFEHREEDFVSRAAGAPCDTRLRSAVGDTSPPPMCDTRLRPAVGSAALITHNLPGDTDSSPRTGGAAEQQRA